MIDATGGGRRHEFSCRKSGNGIGWNDHCEWCDGRDILLTVEDLNVLIAGYGDDCPAESASEIIERIRAAMKEHPHRGTP